MVLMFPDWLLNSELQAALSLWLDALVCLGSTALLGSIYKRGLTYWVKYYRAGRPFRESSGSRKRRDAERLLKKREGQVAAGVAFNPRADRVLVDELFEDLLLDYRVRGHRSLADAKRRIRLHLLPYWSRSKAAFIRKPHVDRYIVLRQDAGAANATINRELALLRRAINLGHESGKLNHPARISLLPEDNARSGFLTDEQVNQLIRALPDDLQAMFRTAAITGWRIRSELMPMKRHQLDFEARTLRLEPGKTKNREGRIFPMTDQLFEVLSQQEKKTGALQKKLGKVIPWVFHRDGNRIRNCYTAWRSACKKAGCPGRIPHDLRRTAVRNLVRAGVPERVAMQLTGHKTRTIFERYNIISGGDLQIAVDRLESYRKTAHSKS